MCGNGHQSHQDQQLHVHGGCRRRTASLSFTIQRTTVAVASLCPLLKLWTGGRVKGGGCPTFSGGRGGRREEEADFLDWKCVGWESRRKRKLFLLVLLLHHLCCLCVFLSSSILSFHLFLFPPHTDGHTH